MKGFGPVILFTVVVVAVFVQMTEGAGANVVGAEQVGVGKYKPIRSYHESVIIFPSVDLVAEISMSKVTIK